MVSLFCDKIKGTQGNIDSIEIEALHYWEQGSTYDQ